MLTPRTTACAPQDLAQASSWLNNTCVKSNATHWLLQVCNSTGVVSASCTDPQCTRCPEISAYPTQRCGTISRNGTNQGLFFTCYVGQTPPTLSSQNNAVYNERTYFGDAGCGGVAQIYSQISTVSGVCVVGEKRTCSQCTNGGYARRGGGHVRLPLTPFVQYLHCRHVFRLQRHASVGCEPQHVRAQNGGGQRVPHHHHVLCRSCTDTHARRPQVSVCFLMSPLPLLTLAQQPQRPRPQHHCVLRVGDQF